MAKGGIRPGAGRKKGTRNRDREELQAKLDRLGCDPFEGMATIAINQLPCGVCRGKGKTPYKLDGSAQIHMRTCESCYGTMFEACSPELRGKMHAEIAQYVAPKRKAIEISGHVSTSTAESIIASRAKRMKEKE